EWPPTARRLAIGLSHHRLGERAHGDAPTTARHRGSSSEPESSSKYIQHRGHFFPLARPPIKSTGARTPSWMNSPCDFRSSSSSCCQRGAASSSLITLTFDTTNNSFRRSASFAAKGAVAPLDPPSES